MDPFSVSIDHRDTGVIARFAGRAANAQADAVRDALGDLLRDRPSPVVIDLARLEFIASAALAELIGFRQNVQAYGGRMRLAGAPDHIASVFRATRLVDLFPMYRDAEEALGSARA